MKSSILRVVFRSRADLDEFLQTHVDLQPDAVWRAGERRVLGGAHTDNGLNIQVASGERWSELLSETRGQLLAMKAALESAHVAGAMIVLDFGFTVGAPLSFTGTASFDLPTLKLCVDLGLSLQVSAYPSSQ